MRRATAQIFAWIHPEKVSSPRASPLPGGLEKRNLRTRSRPMRGYPELGRGPRHLTEELERAPGIGGTSPPMLSTRPSRGQSMLSRLRRSLVDEPLEEQQPSGPIGNRPDSQEPHRDAEDGQPPCAPHPGRHRIDERGTESTSTYGGWWLGQGGHRNLQKDGNHIEQADWTRSGTCEKLLSVFWTDQRWAQAK
jgi:hypothetical protein